MPIYSAFSLLDDAFAELQAYYASAWAVKLDFDAITAARINWVDLADRYQKGEGEFRPPITVLDFDKPRESDFSGLTGQSWEVDVHLWYVLGTASASGAARSAIVSDLRKSCETMAWNMWARDQAAQWTNFQILRQPLVDVTDDSDANSVFLASDWPYVAGCIEFPVLVGYTSITQVGTPAYPSE